MHKIMRQKTRIERSVKSASGQESFIIRLGISFVVVLGTAARNARAKEIPGVDKLVANGRQKYTCVVQLTELPLKEITITPQPRILVFIHQRAIQLKSKKILLCILSNSIFRPLQLWSTFKPSSAASVN